MNTDTKKLEKVLLQDFFNNNKIYDYEDIKAKGKEILGSSYSEGKVSGLINKLVKKNIITRVSRGRYKNSGNYKIDIEKLTKESLEKALIEIKEYLSKVNISNLNDDEFLKIGNVRNIIKNLEGFLK